MATSPLVNIDALNTVYEAICNQFKERVYTTTANPSEILGTSSAPYNQAYIRILNNDSMNWYITSAGAARFNGTLHAYGKGTIDSGLTVTGNTDINHGSLNVNSTFSASTFEGTLSVTNDLTAKRHFTLGTTSSTSVDSMRWYDAIIDERELPPAFKVEDPNTEEIQAYKAKDNKITSAKWVEAYAGARLSVLEKQISGKINPQIEDLNRSVFGSIEPGETTASSGKIYNLNTTNATSNTDTNAAIYTAGGLAVKADIYAEYVHNAVWNDLADCIPVPEDTELEYGYCYKFDGENYTKTSNYSDSQFIGIHSDTAGFYMGERPTKTLKASVAGFVLAYVDKVYKPGTLLTCTKDGKLTKANLFTRLFKPHSIIASFWKDELEEEWGPSSRKIKVNGRKWIKIK